jgi:hypothetical protein
MKWKYIFIMLTYANMNIIRFWIVLKTNIEQTKRNEGSYFYSYPFGDLAQESFKKVFMCASNKKASWEPS